MNDGTGLAEALLGLEGFRVLEVTETPAEVVIEIETTAEVVGCRGVRGGPRRRTGCRWRSGTCRASGGRRGWCGASAGGVPEALRGEDVDGDLRARVDPGGADAAGRRGGVPPGG